MKETKAFHFFNIYFPTSTCTVHTLLALNPRKKHGGHWKNDTTDKTSWKSSATIRSLSVTVLDKQLFMGKGLMVRAQKTSAVDKIILKSKQVNHGTAPGKNNFDSCLSKGKDANQFSCQALLQLNSRNLQTFRVFISAIQQKSAGPSCSKDG